MSNDHRTLLVAVLLLGTGIESGCDSQAKPEPAGSVAASFANTPLNNGAVPNSAPTSAPPAANAPPTNGQASSGPPVGNSSNPVAYVAHPTPPVPWSARVERSPDAQIHAVAQSTDFPVLDGRVELPHGTNASIAIEGDREWRGYRVLDGRSTGKITAPLPTSSKKAISPDGSFLAISPSETRNAVVQIWSFSDNKLIRELEVAPEGPLETIHFLTSNRFVTGVPVPWGLRVTVWHLRSDQALREFVVPGREKDALLGTPAISPEGRYMALFMSPATLNLYDLESGQCTGRVELGRLGRAAYSGNGQLEFSPNGERLAIYMSPKNESDWLLCWDSATCQQMFDRRYDKTKLSRTEESHVPRYEGRTLQWLPDSSGWLIYGHFVVDATNGEVIEEFAETDGRARAALTAKTVLALDGEPSSRSLRVISATPRAIKTASVNRERTPMNGTPEIPDFAKGRPPQAPVEPSTPRPSPNDLAERVRPEPRRIPPQNVPPQNVPPQSVPPQAPPVPTLPTPAPSDSAVAAAMNKIKDRSFWNVEADPPAQPLGINGSSKIKIPVPSGMQVRLLETPGNFVMIEDSNAGISAVDLRSAETVGKINAKYAGLTRPVASPDGQLLAVFTDDYPRSIEIWSFATGQRLATLKPPTEAKHGSLHFAGSRWLVASGIKPNVVELAAWDLKSHEMVGRATLNGQTDSQPYDTAVTSPGGRYVATLADSMLHVLELPSLKPAGRLPVLTPALPNVPTTVEHQRLAFSPDGTRLAATYCVFGREHLFIWDFVKGQLLLHRHYMQPFRNRETSLRRGAHPLIWFPDNSALLYADQVVLDAVTGAAVWYFPMGDFEPLLPLSLNSVAKLNRASGNDVGTFGSVAVPKLLSQAMDAARKAPSENQPKLTNSDESTIRHVRTYPEKVTWNARPDPLPAGGGKFVDQLVIGDGSTALISDVLLAPADTSLAVVQKATRHEFAGIKEGPMRPERFNTLETWDLSSGKRRKKLDLPATSVIVDVSVDGSLVLTGDQTMQQFLLPARREVFFDRLDVWAPQLDRHAVGWRQSPRFVNHTDQAVSWARFTDKRHVLVGTKDTVTSWALPECRAEYRLHDAGSLAALSPNRKYLLLYHAKRGVELFDTASGEKVGQLETPYRQAGMDLKGAAFHPLGERLVCLLHQSAYTQVLEWNMANGSLTRDFVILNMLNPTKADIRWLGDDYLFASTPNSHLGVLVNLPQQALAAKVEHSFALHAHGAQLPQEWMLKRESTTRGDSEYLARKSIVDQLPAGVDLSSLRAVYHPGVRVRLKANFNLGGMEQVVAIARERLAKNNFVLDDTAPLCVELASEVVEEEVTIPKLRSETKDRKTGRVYQVVVVRIIFYDAAGNILFNDPHRIRLENPPLRPSETIEDFVRRTIHQIIQTTDLPPYLFPPKSHELVPTIKL